MIKAVTGTDAYTEKDRTSLGEMLSWAIASETILANLRVEILMKDGTECADAMDTISTIHKQITETETKL